MFDQRVKLCVVFISLLLFIVPAFVYGQYAVGDTVVDFTATTVTGEEISLFDYKGQAIFLNFFTTG